MMLPRLCAVMIRPAALQDIEVALDVDVEDARQLLVRVTQDCLPYVDARRAHRDIQAVSPAMASSARSTAAPSRDVERRRVAGATFRRGA